MGFSGYILGIEYWFYILCQEVIIDRLLELINRKFLKDSEFLELEDNENVISCEYYRPHNAHYKEFLVTINNNGKIEEHIVCYKAM